MNDGFINLLNCNSATPESSTVRYFVEYISRYDGKPYRLNAEGAGFTVGSKYPTAFPSITGALAALVKRTARRLESSDARIIRVETTPGKTTRKVLGEGEYVVSDDKWAIQLFSGFGADFLTTPPKPFENFTPFLAEATLFDSESAALQALQNAAVTNNGAGHFYASYGMCRLVRVAITTSAPTVTETVLA